MDSTRNQQLATPVWLAVLAIAALLLLPRRWLAAAAQSFGEGWDLETEGPLAA